MTEKFKRQEIKEEEPQEDWWGDFLKALKEKYKEKKKDEDHSADTGD